MPRRKRGKNSVDPGLPEGIPTRFDVIGDIAVVNIPAEFEDYYSDAAAYVAGKRANVRTVLNRKAPAGNEFRVPRFEVIYGDPRTITVHREAGFSYMVDLGDSFFNPRLCTERIRVAGMVNENERVLVPFAGVGPFAIPPARKGAKVYAIEMNPAACGWLRKNVELNVVRENFDIIRGDAHDLPDMFSTEFDRAIVPAPYGFDESLNLSASYVKKGGFIHFYTFKRPAEIAGLNESYEKMGLEIVSARRCGNVAKGVSRWVFDLKKM
jgi:tRNA (guanine37-N1)-methyltransferase